MAVDKVHMLQMPHLVRYLLSLHQPHIFIKQARHIKANWCTVIMVMCICHDHVMVSITATGSVSIDTGSGSMGIGAGIVKLQLLCSSRSERWGCGWWRCAVSVCKCSPWKGGVQQAWIRRQLLHLLIPGSDACEPAQKPSEQQAAICLRRGCSNSIAAQARPAPMHIPQAHTATSDLAHAIH